MKDTDTHQFNVLAAAARQADADDPRWRALSSGALSPEEVDALREEAERSEEGRALWDLYRPFSEEEKLRLVRGVHEGLRAARKEPASLPVPGSFARFVEAIQGRMSWRRGATAVTLAAATVLLYLQVRPPLVEVAFDGDRGPEPAPRVLSRPDADLTEAITPVRPIAGNLVVRGTLLLERSGATRAWAPHLNPASAQNVIFLAGTKQELFPCVPAGTWEMIVAVGLPGGPLSEEEMTRLAGKPPSRSVHVVHRTVVLEGEPVNAAGTACRESKP